MSKTCKNQSCKFADNPDNANYCGRCGKPLKFTYSGSPISFTVIESSELSSLRSKSYRVDELTRENRELRNNTVWNKINNAWTEFKDFCDEWWGAVFIWVLVFGVAAGIFYYVRSCNREDIKVIEVNGQYGIGYNEDKLLVEAQYDTILTYSRSPNLYLICKDSTHWLYGLAYVDDSNTRIIEPEYKSYAIFQNGFAALGSKEDWTLTHNGKTIGQESYKYITPIPNDSTDTRTCVIVHRDNTSDIYNAAAEELTNEHYLQYYKYDCDIVSMQKSYQDLREIDLYNFSGQRINDETYDRCAAFSTDSVAWAQTKEDYQHTNLINSKGEILFKIPRTFGATGFQNGRAWMWDKLPGDCYLIDMTGKTISIKRAYSVGRFQNGIAPVFTKSKTSGLGFVDTSGNTVIPFEYNCYIDPIFDENGNLEVFRSGKKGLLNCNGTFTPSR